MQNRCGMNKLNVVQIELKEIDPQPVDAKDLQRPIRERLLLKAKK